MASKTICMRSLALGVALIVTTPAIAQTELEEIKQQVAEQRRMLERQQKMLDEQQKVIDRLEKQLVSQEGAPPKEPPPAPPPPVTAKTPIEIYGALYPLAENISATGATAPAPANHPTQLPASAYTGTNQGGRNRLTVGTSNIGFRGTVDIAEGYKALWQIEAGAAIDGDSASIGGSNAFGLRNSAVGLTGPFGTAFFGNWDTPYKWSALATNILPGGQVFDDNNILGNPGFGVPGTTTQSTRVNGKADAAFDRRQGNSIQYWTPMWNGLTARFAYSFDEGKSGSTGIPVTSPEVLGASLSFENGPLALRYAYEQHNDYFGMTQLGGTAPSTTNTSSKDVGNKVIAIYTFGNTTVSGIYEWLRYSNSDSGAAANVSKYKRNGYYLMAQQKFGANKVWASYGSTNDGSCSTAGGVACTTGGLGAAEWVVGYVHNLNKYVDLYAVYYDIRNKESGTYQPVTSLNVPLNTTPAPGLNIQSFGVGMLFAF
jgi:predicted porin/uncharacterized coiled-coil protein SlyX